MRTGPSQMPGGGRRPLRLSGCPVEGTFSVHPRGRPRGELQEAEGGAEGGETLFSHGTIHQKAASAPNKAKSSHPTIRSMGLTQSLPRSARAPCPAWRGPPASTHREAADSVGDPLRGGAEPSPPHRLVSGRVTEPTPNTIPRSGGAGTRAGSAVSPTRARCGTRSATAGRTLRA
jgi:hypothetical protein